MRKNSFTLYLLIFSVAYLYATENSDSEKQPVGLDFFTKVKQISQLKEKDGNIFFVLTQTDLENNQYTKGLFQLVNGEAVLLVDRIADYFLINDELIFRYKKSENEESPEEKESVLFYKYDIADKSITEWLTLPFSFNRIEWIDKNTFFYTSLYHHTAGDEKSKEKDSYRIFDELPFWSNGKGDISGLRSHLYYYKEGESVLLSDTLENVSSFYLSPDKRTLVFTKRDAVYGKSPEYNSLVSLDTESFNKREWPLFPEATYGNIYFLDDKEIVFTANRQKEHNKIENAEIHRLNLFSGERTDVYDGAVYGFGNSIGTDIGGSGKLTFNSDEGGIYYVTTKVDYAPLIHIAYKDTAVSFITAENITVQEYIPYKEGFLIVALVNQQGSEIYYADKEHNFLSLSAINKSLFDTHRILEPIELSFINEDQIELKGYILPPANYVKGEKYPAILDVHGGPKTAYGTVFFHEMQYWANLGYAVLFTNPTGSDGRGSVFSDIRGKVGEIDYRDLITFVDEAVKQIDFIDENRLGVTGGSYGGLMTNWIIGQTDRFKAAASQRSISSWLSFSNTSDIGHTFTYNYWGTNLWENTALLWDHSPLKYADRVKTPTLFIHSEEDYRCWLVEGLQMYYALQYFNVPSRIVIFRNENHELSRSGKPANRIKRLSEITGWFEKYL